MPSLLAKFRRSLAKSRPVPSGLPTIPPGQLVYAIGDVHGRLDLLENLLMQIDADAVTRTVAKVDIVLLGDLIDRGPDSYGVVELCIGRDWGNATPRFLAGNHEEMLMSVLDGNADSLRPWAKHGGIEAMQSYGVSDDIIDRGTEQEIIGELARKIPPEHLRFLRRMADYIVIGDYWFVHAGVAPGIAIEQQDLDDLRWIRGAFLDYAEPFGGMVIHGHTISDGVDEQSNRIGIDTGAFSTGVLTAIGLKGQERWYLST